MKRDVPKWFIALIIVVALPVAGYPWLLSMWPAGTDGVEDKIIIWVYPAYVVLSGVLAGVCWPRRRAESWILLVLMVLAHAAMWGMCVVTTNS